MTTTPATTAMTTVADLRTGDTVKVAKGDWRRVASITQPSPGSSATAQASITWDPADVPAGCNLWTGMRPTRRVRVAR